jgi:dolichyl-diphosphooligosaccharide--protein glycosyltransferase
MVSSWGGYVFITNLIPLYILFLIFIGRTNIKIYTSYSIFYVLGNALAMQIPFVGTLIFKSSEHFLSHGVFIILNFVIFIKFLKKIVKKEENVERLFKLLFFFCYYILWLIIFIINI